MTVDVDQYVGEIRMFAGNFAPAGWAQCNGQLLPISQNTALFSLLGTSYGGDGLSTFALPDLTGTSPLHQGQGPGLDSYAVGDSGGTQTVTLVTPELPAHRHTVQGADVRGDRNSPAGATWAQAAIGRVVDRGYATASDGTHMHASAMASAGSSFPHGNMPPYLVVTFIIALQGSFPPPP